MLYSGDMLAMLMYWLSSFDDILFKKVLSGEFDNFRWAVTATDEYANLLYVNNSFCRLVGYTREELLQKNAFSILTRDAYTQLQGHFEYFLVSRSKFRCDILELTYVHSSGEQLKVEEIGRSMTIDGRHYVLSLIYIPDPQKKQDQELAYYLNHLEKEFSRLSSENILLRRELASKHTHGPLIGRSRPFMQTMDVVERVAVTDATVLILGETGTGKELLARCIHDLSARHDHPLVKVNCAALPSSLMESELFGHARGAFTSAVESHIGRFESAQHGTIFLDEIGELPLALQAKLLRVLQEKEMNRVGDSRTIKVDVRIIAATNRDLQQEVRKGTFRNDLYYRLNVLPITSPPLRERTGDIPLLVQHFLDRANRKFGRQVEIIPKATMNRLCAYAWPGNIRELENLIERSVILSTDRILELGDMQRITTAPTEGAARLMTLEEIEKDYVVKILVQTGWRVSGERGAAKILGLNPKTLESRMRKMGIRRPELQV